MYSTDIDEAESSKCMKSNSEIIKVHKYLMEPTAAELEVRRHCAQSEAGGTLGGAAVRYYQLSPCLPEWQT